MDLSGMTDSEIRQQLISLGQDVGPVTSTTRAVHLKKLRSLLARGDVPTIEHVALPTITNGNGLHHLEIVDGESTVQVERPSNELRENNGFLETSDTPKVPLVHSLSPPAVDDGSDEEMRGEESVRYLSPEEMELEISYNRNCTSLYGSQSGNFRKVLLVVLLMALVVFLFFLSDRVHRQNIDPTADEEL